MRTLTERIYETKIGEGLYRMSSPSEIRLPVGLPGIGIEGSINCPGPEMPFERAPLEVMLGYQAPQSLFVMYSFGINDKPVTIGNWFPPLAGATIGPYESPNPFNFSKNTAYAPLGFDKQYNIGVSHHSTGLGKIKVFDNSTGIEYGVPICDISRPMNEWRIDKNY
ncbi:hypothetical protein FJZ53_00200 [Candidatus Woesearchaeota archaeon]|nr:hypothetical protein [Candidatus Woesearchaeota archaeon]